MTVNEFLEECKTTPWDDFQWSNQAKVIRAKRKGSNDSYCPITAMCFQKTGKDYPKCLFTKAGIDLGMDVTDMGEIVSASDFYSNNNSELFHKLCKTLGITK